MSLFHRLLRAITVEDAPHATRIPGDSHIDETLEHAKGGYKNAQDVIKFVDTKTAVVTGLSTLIGGSLIGVLKWTVESEKNTHATIMELAANHPCAVAWFKLFVAGCFAAMFVCVAAAVWSVIARARPRHLENTFTVLFPCYKQRDQTAACKAISTKLAGMSKTELLLEYEDQLRVVGMILGKKLKHIRVACFALLVELLFFVLAVCFLSFLYVSTPEALHCDRSVVTTCEKAEKGLLRQKVDFDHAGTASLGLASHLAGVLAGRELKESSHRAERQTRAELIFAGGRWQSCDPPLPSHLRTKATARQGLLRKHSRAGGVAGDASEYEGNFFFRSAV